MAKKHNNKGNYIFNNKAVDFNRKKYCRFKKSGIKYIDYKDADFLMKFLNEQGKLLPRRITGNSFEQLANLQTPKTAQHSLYPERLRFRT